MENSLKRYLLDSRLYIDEELEEFANNFVNTQGFKKDISDKRIIMQNWYDGYLFCFWIGLRYSVRKSKFKRKDKAGGIWNDVKRQDQYLYLITKMLIREENQIEIGINSRRNLNSIGNMKELADKILNLANEYTFGGLELLKQEYDQFDGLFESLDYVIIIKNNLDKRLNVTD